MSTRHEILPAYFEKRVNELNPEVVLKSPVWKRFHAQVINLWRPYALLSFNPYRVMGPFLNEALAALFCEYRETIPPLCWTEYHCYELDSEEMLFRLGQKNHHMGMAALGQIAGVSCQGYSFSLRLPAPLMKQLDENPIGLYCLKDAFDVAVPITSDYRILFEGAEVFPFALSTDEQGPFCRLGITTTL